MTPTEGRLLQSMEGIHHLPEPASKAYEALGNAVNVRVARRVAMALIGHASDEQESVVIEQGTLSQPPMAVPLA